MKKRLSISVSCVLIALLMFTGCSLFKGKEDYTNEYDEGTVVTDSSAQTDVITEVDGTGVSDASADVSEASGEGETESDPIQELLDEIDNIDMGDDEDLPEWLVEAGNQIDITVTVVNLCGVDIGMVSTIDPYTDEQVDLGGLPADQLINISELWPRDKTIFDLAIYNVNGELVSASEVDITGIKEKVTITLSGDGDLENIESVVE